MDIGEYLLTQAGAELRAEFEFETLSAALTGDAFTGREFVYNEQSRDNILTDTEFMTMVRSRDWKLVHFLGESNGQLFDLREDPGEIYNLWHDAVRAGVKRELLDQLREWRIASQYRTRDWAREYR
jgi:arylsulfatase A-like enzyme